ncbi:type I polyketide synthase [Streptomyces sp. NPDC018031]|uniref:type I polyketide synthase n=1 Tax=Streptomyces sp. NPDC018031 TaxID=3365033 RepID=UPI0037A4FC05
MPIAVVGMACRLPGATGPERFWTDVLLPGRDAVGEAPEGRWTHEGGDPRPGHPDRAGWLDRVDTFDAEFFGIPPREATAMDPQQRLMLELSWEAVEHARISADTLRDGRTGVFTAALWNDYAELTADPADGGGHAFTAAHRAMLAGRVSYALRLRGPSLTVDTGQSSSLVAVHLACESLRRGESSSALVGGVNLIVTPGPTVAARVTGVLSADGRCRPLDARADGYVRGEGGAVLLLKPLAAAEADGDVVHGVILGSAVNNDGGGDTLTTPHRAAQEEVLRQAHRDAGTDPAQAQYVELHGTGTPAGDPVEAHALGAVYGPGRAADRPLRVGSVKTNIGHLEAAAGVVGLLKTVLSLRDRELPPSLHFERAHPDIPLESLGLSVQRERGPWPETGRPLLAGVSAFALAGTNCHVVVAEPPRDRVPGAPAPAPAEGAGRVSVPGDTPQDAPGTTPVPWVLSARSAAALRAQAERLLRHTEARPGPTVRDIAHSLATTRATLAHRAVLLGSDRAELRRDLAELARGGRPAGGVLGTAGRTVRPVFVFPGQGAQWAGMARELMASAPVFARTMERCGQALAPHVDWDFATELDGPLDRVEVIQPMLWAVMVSLAELWRSYGVEPAAVVGHSMGEVAAAVVSGGLTTEDGARVMAHRSRLMGAHLSGTGGMAALELPRADAEARAAEHAGRLSVAVVNGPLSTVVGGDSEALDSMVARCKADGIRAGRLLVDYASHSPAVDPVLDRYRDGLTDLTPRPSRVPYYSTIVGEPLDTTGLDADYWVRNERDVVEFERITRRLLADGYTAFVEISVHPVLTMNILATAEEADAADGLLTVGTIQRDEGGLDRFLRSAATAFAGGVPVDFGPAHTGGRRVDLPTYPFQRTSYWTARPAPRTAGPLPGGPGTAARDPELRPRTADAEPDATGTAPQGDGEPPLVRRLATASAAERDRALLDLVRDQAAAVIGHGSGRDIAPDTSFVDAGLSSLTAVQFRDGLSAETGLRLPTTLLYRHPTPAGLARQLHDRLFPRGGEADAPPLWDQWERLEHTVISAELADQDRTWLAERLRGLLGKLGPTPAGTPDTGGAAAGDEEIAAASDDEMFALINKELGLS